MNITEVRVKWPTPLESAATRPHVDDTFTIGDRRARLLAYCSVTLGGAYVIHDIKVIHGSNGPFVAMPSRKLTDRCDACGGKNHLCARYCNSCGADMGPAEVERDNQGRSRLFMDVAHPLNQEAKAVLDAAVLEAYRRELAARPADAAQAAGGTGVTVG